MGLEAQRMDMLGRGRKNLIQVHREGHKKEFMSFYIEMVENDCDGTREKNKATM